ncbi:MAG TPA: glycosyltransferase [Pyrinomonadaceae bacterium]|jgi:Glycosyltransferase|nr:glycosyltransferase [Pyrinomonadaceae bacterium]
MTDSSRVKDPRTLCIVVPYAPTATETFIKNHIQNLPANVVTVDSWRPQIDGRTVLGTPSRVFHKLLRLAGSDLQRELTAAYGKAFRSNNVAAVLAEYGTTGVVTVDACRQLNIPLIVYFFGYDATVRSVLEENAETYPHLFKEAKAIIAVSRSIKRKLISIGASAEKIHFIPCGVDTDQFTGAQPAQADPVFLAVGRFVEKKAPHLTIKAFALAHEAYPSASLRMIGDGPLFEECRKLAETLGVQDAIHFLGTRPHAELQQEMNGARCFVQHSVEAPSGDCEGTPVGILEAGASGLPVISTRHAGIPDIVVEGETGYLVDEGDFEGMAQHMIAIAQDPELAATLGRAARKQIAKHFSVDQCNADLWRIIEACMNGVSLVADEI